MNVITILIYANMVVTYYGMMSVTLLTYVSLGVISCDLIMMIDTFCYMSAWVYPLILITDTFGYMPAWV